MKKLPCVLAVLVLMVSAVALAELCPKCKNQSYTKDVGKCSQCGGRANSGQFQLCMQCSGKLNQCEHCRAPLSASQPATSPAEKIDTGSDGTYKSAPWEYRYSISNKGSRSEGCFGDLLYGGKDVPAPQEINDHILTPWGMMYWIGNRAVAFGAHRWMLKPSPSGKSGRLLADPSGKQQAAVFVQVLYPNANVDKSELADWVKAALEKEGVKDAKVDMDWFVLTPAPIVLHDSRHYGRAEIYLGNVTPGKSITVETPGKSIMVDADLEKIELPYRDGATKLVKHTITSSSKFGVWTMYLALRVEVSLPTAASAPASAGEEAMLACRRAMLECEQAYFNLFAAYQAKRVNEDNYKKGLELYKEARLATDELGKELAVARDEADTAPEAPGGRDEMTKGVGEMKDAAIEKARQMKEAAAEKVREKVEKIKERIKKLEPRPGTGGGAVRG